ncbi:deoxyribonuclease V [Orbaceae bacterium ac157xtp]
MSIDLAKLKQQQMTLAKKVILHDVRDFSQVKLIAGTDVGFEDNGETTRAAIVVLTYPELEVVEYQIARIKTEFPYIPGYLSFREYPALLQAFKQLNHKPELLIVDGHGVSHPRGIGIASHLGVLLDIPTIGVAKKRLYGQYKAVLNEVFAYEKLYDKANINQIGWVVRSKLRCNELFVSAGNQISQKTALSFILTCFKGYRLPEPTRIADAIASNKPYFKKVIKKHE